jgi:hypothetical protein
MEELLRGKAQRTHEENILKAHNANDPLRDGRPWNPALEVIPAAVAVAETNLFRQARGKGT